jgi:hypothetical protein
LDRSIRGHRDSIVDIGGNGFLEINLLIYF